MGKLSIFTVNACQTNCEHGYIGTLAHGYMTGGLDFVAQGSSLHCGLVAIIVAS